MKTQPATGETYPKSDLFNKAPTRTSYLWFYMFLFAVGYSVGPQFIRAIRSDGMPQVVFTVIVCLSGLGTAILIGKGLHYGGPMTAGLLAGGYSPVV
ncbi:hypothetical protein L9F46_005757 [Klebsiella pneumoniae]